MKASRMMRFLQTVGVTPIRKQSIVLLGAYLLMGTALGCASGEFVEESPPMTGPTHPPTTPEQWRALESAAQNEAQRGGGQLIGTY